MEFPKVCKIIEYKSKSKRTNILKLEAIQTFNEKGYIVVERNCHNGHMLVLGGKRRVNYYPSTETVFVDKEVGKPSLKTKGMEQALHILKHGTLLYRKT